MTLPAELYTAAQVRDLDSRAIANGISGFELMQRAARVALHAVTERWPACRSLLILTGSGNNGGDGLVMAVLARQQGIRATVFTCADLKTLQGEALQAATLLADEGVPCISFSEDAFTHELNASNLQDTLVIDALLGTGHSGALRGIVADAVASINASSLPVVSLDVPSGLCSTTGSVASAAVTAVMTVCFVALKQGLFTGKGPACCGEILFHDLDTGFFRSTPPLAPSVRRIDIQSVARLFHSRVADTHKGNCGHVVVIGGELGFGGAALLAAEAAARSGAGKVSLLTRSAHITAMLTRCPEIMVYGTDAIDAETLQHIQNLLAQASVIVVGPGLGTSDWSKQLLQLALQQNTKGTALVVDADALNLLSAGFGGGSARRNWILTPHPGEAARLLNCDIASVQADRFAAVRNMQTQLGGAVLLKGAGSLVCYATDAQHIDVCTEGNPGMASAGMGDVLSGIIGAFVAQGLGLSNSLRAAVCVHGEAADLQAAMRGQRGLLASDLLQRLGELINSHR